MAQHAPPRPAAAGPSPAGPSRSSGTDGGSTGGIGLAGLCDYDYEVAVGDTTLSVQELQRLAEAKAPLVRLRGRWVELRAGDVERALAILQRPAGTRSPAQRDMTAAEVLRVGLGLDPPPSLDLPVVGVVAEGWLGALLGTEATDGRPRRRGSKRSPPRPASTACCGPTRSGAWPGCGSCSATGSAPAWPTTWASARPPSSWP